jgi:hypothetical protein
VLKKKKKKKNSVKKDNEINKIKLANLWLSYLGYQYIIGRFLHLFRVIKQVN